MPRSMMLGMVRQVIFPLLLVGAIPVTLLSLATDFLFGMLERRLTPRGMRAE